MMTGLGVPVARLTPERRGAEMGLLVSFLIVAAVAYAWIKFFEKK